MGRVPEDDAYLDAMVNRLLDPKILLLAFDAIMVFGVIRMLMPSTSDGGACALPGGGINWRSCLPKAIATGAVVGFLTGLLRIGGGFLIVPALTLILGLPMALTVGTSLVIIVINSAAGFAAHLGDLQVDWAVTAAFAVTAMAASLAAGRIGLPSEQLREDSLAGRLFMLVPAAAYGARNPAHDLVNVLATTRPRRLLALLACRCTAHLFALLPEWIIPSLYPMGYLCAQECLPHDRHAARCAGWGTARK